MKHATMVALVATGLFATGCGKKDDDNTGAKDDPAAKAKEPGGKADPAGGNADPAGGKVDPAGGKVEPAVAKAEPATFCGAEPCPCEPGTENKHYQTELLQSCKLSKPMTVQGYPVKPGSEGGDVAFTKEGQLVRFYLSEDFEVHGFPAQAKTGVELFADGSLRSLYLREGRELDGIPCTNGVTFFEGGKLRRCNVDKEVELSGHKVQPGDWITLDKDGKLHRWEVGDRTVTIGKHECSGYLNYVHPTGELLRCGFAKETKVEGKKYKPGDLVCFDTAGKVADCTQFSFDVGGG